MGEPQPVNNMMTPRIPDACHARTSRVSKNAMNSLVFYKHVGVSSLVNEDNAPTFYKDIETFGVNQTVRQVLLCLKQQIETQDMLEPDLILFNLRGVPILCLLNTTKVKCSVTKPTKMLAFYEGDSVEVGIETIRQFIQQHEKKMQTHILLRYPEIIIVLFCIILFILGWPLFVRSPRF